MQPFPEATDRWRVSTDGDSGPFWRSDGRELFFMNGGSELAVVSVRLAPDGSSLSFGEPEPLFTLELKASRTRQLDTIDGRTFVVNRAVGDVDATPLTLVLNGISLGTQWSARGFGAGGHPTSLRSARVQVQNRRYTRGSQTGSRPSEPRMGGVPG